MKARKIIIVLLIPWIFLLSESITMTAGGGNQKEIKLQEQRVRDWVRDRNEFFKNHQRSPLPPEEKKIFKGLKYYPFDSRYVFHGPIERYVFHINNPKYYATFLTNKGTNKRYIRYGKFNFVLNGKKYTMEIYKSILSDFLFIPFKDKTNEKETYEGGRYIDAEILMDYQMILDFNQAYSPACAYNEKYVCVLPPKENMLEIEIPAGEKLYK